VIAVGIAVVLGRLLWLSVEWRSWSSMELCACPAAYNDCQ